MEQAKLNLDDFLDLDRERFYTGLAAQYDTLFKQWKSTIKTYKNSLDDLIKALKGREKDIFKEKRLPELADVSVDILEIIKKFNLLIDQHNTKTSTLASDQQKAKTDLRLSEIAQYIIDIDYHLKHDEINKLDEEVKQQQAEVLTSQEEIEKPKKYGQLFISTHNLDFLKYLKKLSTPRYKPFSDSKSKPDVNHFLIERKTKRNIELRLAPDYLKMYITEFNFLFHHIYECSRSDNTTIEHHYQYNFGNNMRKFLEAFLFYKYPNHKLSFEERIEKFFDDDSVSFNLVKRVVHEYSHLGEQFDRGLEPIDVAEIQKISEAVINRIKKFDESQYEALLESIQN